MATTSKGQEITTTEGRCMRCKEQVPFTVSRLDIWKNGMEVAVGTHTCGTVVNRILGKAQR